MPIINIKNLSKEYKSGTKALDNVTLQIKEGEIFGLLGPNGAGKTTLISIVNGLVNATSGSVSIAGFDYIKEYRKARTLVGLVPQELLFDGFITVMQTLKYARGFFGKKWDADLAEKTLKSLELWGKRDEKVMALSGGMKRRVLIARALMNEPRVLFLDEPTAGVDVELRRSMLELVKDLKRKGVTIILTTHYLEEAEELADRIGIINNGKLEMVEEKEALMKRLGEQELHITLEKTLELIPNALQTYNLALNDSRKKIIYTYKTENRKVAQLLADLKENGIIFTDLETKRSSLEDIFVKLTHKI